MHIYTLTTLPANANVIALLDDQFLLGVVGNEAEAQAAYDRWADTQEGVKARTPHDGITLPELPCTVSNLPELVAAASTGERVWVGTGDQAFPDEAVMTETQMDAYAAFMVEDRWEMETEDGEGVRFITLEEAAALVYGAATEVDNDFLALLR